MEKRDIMPYRQSTLGVVMNIEGKYLVVNKNSYIETQWSFPGGGIDEGETPEEALIRELSEELMSDKFEIVGKSKNSSFYEWPDDLVENNYIKKGVYQRGQELTQFLVKFTGDDNEVRAGDGIRKVKWVSRDELKNYLIFPNQIENALILIEEFSNL